MEISWNSTVAISYILTDKFDGQVLEKTPEDNIMKFKFGIGELLPKFEENLLGLSAKEEFDFVIEAKDAYGPVDSYAVFDIPKDTFEVDGKVDEKMLQVGNKVPMTDNEGNKHVGTITHVLEDAVTMNFNHPLAGMDIRFVGKILEVIE